MNKKVIFIVFFFIMPQITNTKEKKQEQIQNAKEEISLSKKALNIVISYLKNSDSDIRAYAIEALSKTQNTKLIPILKKYLNDSNKYVVISTVKALWELGDTNSIDYLYKIVSDIPAVNPYKNDPLTQLKIISQNKIREKAIETIVELIGIKSNKILLELKNNDNFPQIRDVASRELAKIGYIDEIEIFYNALKSNDEAIRNQAAENLVRICPTDASKIIEAIKKEKSIRVKILLFDSLKCAILNKKDEEDLLKYINDENITIRHKAISAILNTKNSKIIEQIKKIYNDTPDILIKLTILKKLLPENNIKIEESDVEYLNSVNDADVKRNFIKISQYIPELSKRHLITYLDDTDPYVQIDAAISIIMMENKK